MTLFATGRAEADLQRVLSRLASDDLGPDEHLESRHVDLKVESDWGGRGRPEMPPPHRNPAIDKLAGFAVCMANTLGGGALIVGVGDDNQLIGATLDGEQVRHRIYEKTDHLLTVTAEEVVVRGVRLLVLRCPEALHPITWDHKYRHRVADHCVEVDASTWQQARWDRAGYDWSSTASTVPATEVRASSVERARDFLRAAADDRSSDLAAARDGDLLRRLNVVTGDGHLTQAGVLAFVGRGDAALDYQLRPAQGADSTVRRRVDGRGLLEELYEVFTAVELATTTTHLPLGLVQQQVTDPPARAAREAVVNGVAHRDWTRPEPTLVEHFPRRFVVTSPGGFVRGITSANIITHPSQSRNRALAELLASLHVAEREGIGVDRMVGDVLRTGHPAPSITEVEGPYVRVALLGGRPDLGWMAFCSSLLPTGVADGLDMLLLLRRLTDEWWVDRDVAAVLLQRPVDEADAALADLVELTLDGGSVVEPVDGTPASAPPAWQLTARARSSLRERQRQAGVAVQEPTRAQVAHRWARGRGRVSSTELASLVGAHPTNLQGVLRSLEDEGALAPGRESRRGAGFFYIPVG